MPVFCRGVVARVGNRVVGIGGFGLEGLALRVLGFHCS